MKYGNRQARCQLILFPFPRHRGRPHFPFSQELHWTMWLANGYGQKWCIPLPGLAMNCFSHPFALPLPQRRWGPCAEDDSTTKMEGARIPESPPRGERLRIATYPTSDMKWARNKHFSKVILSRISYMCFWVLFCPMVCQQNTKLL